MCVRVQYVSAEIHHPYDATRNVIRIPTHLDGEYALRAVRMVLTELAIEQPETGARCWCGEHVSILARVPEQWSAQMTDQQTAANHGA